MSNSANILFAKGQQQSTDYWNDFGYFNDGTVWYETTPVYTARVTAYAAATGITDYTILDALNIFDLGLTYYGLDTIMKSIHPMVTDKTSQLDMANQMKYNFMNPLDTNAAFRLQWFGGWIYSRTGALPNGVDAYTDTFLIPNTNLTSNSHHLSFYSRTNNTTNGYELACQSIQASSTQYGYMLLSTYNSGTSYYQQQTQNTNAITPSEANTLGFYNGSRTSSTSFKAYKNGVLRGSNTNIASAIGSYLAINSIYLSAWNVNNNGTISTIGYSNKQCSFASIGDGLTDSQAQIFSSLVNNLQIALNRAVY